MHCPQLVCKVSSESLAMTFIVSLTLRVSRCMARNKDLDTDVLYRCKEHMNLLVEDIDLGVLWNEYGIVGDLVVCHIMSAHVANFNC